MPNQNEHILVTGGCGFIGSNFVRRILNLNSQLYVTNLDVLTYSGNPENLSDIVDKNGPDGDSRYRFIHADIRDHDVVSSLLKESVSDTKRPPIDAIVHFAAESHVDRSILGPKAFIDTNVTGTMNLLESCREMADELPTQFRFVHVSTDEVYGSLGFSDPPFTESTPLAPNSPYAASKAGSDLLVRSYYKTFGFPAIITRCSNNYGPYQYPEKLIPLVVTRAIRNSSVPVYGDGKNIRDWIHVEDHCAAIATILQDGSAGETYNISADCELSNLEIVETILESLEKPQSLIKFVTDRPGHDRRYAMSNRHVCEGTVWRPAVDFTSGIQSTIEWYIANERWWHPLLPESTRTSEALYKM